MKGMSKKPGSTRIFSKRLRRMVRYRPSLNLVALALLFVTIFLIGGGIYMISMPPEEVSPYYRGLVIISPGTHSQTLTEGIAVMLVYALGAAGLILIYRSARHRYNPKQAYMLISIGVILLILAFAIIEIILLHKIRI